MLRCASAEIDFEPLSLMAPRNERSDLDAFKISVDIYIYIYVFICVITCIYMYVYVDVYIHVYQYKPLDICVCMYKMHMCIHIYIFVACTELPATLLRPYCASCTEFESTRPNSELGRKLRTSEQHALELSKLNIACS